MKKKIYLAIGAVILATAFWLHFFQNDQARAEVRIGGKSISADVAQTPSSRERGLSGRKNLPEGSGMLFVFGARGRYSFWMKDMFFPIDIVWIGGNSIVDIAPDVPPPAQGAELRVYEPRESADFVLEVPAGMAMKSGWKIGDTVEINY